MGPATDMTDRRLSVKNIIAGIPIGLKVAGNAMKKLPGDIATTGLVILENEHLLVRVSPTKDTPQPDPETNPRANQARSRPWVMITSRGVCGH
jgi:hypothetical protein